MKKWRAKLLNFFQKRRILEKFLTKWSFKIISQLEKCPSMKDFPTLLTFNC